MLRRARSWNVASSPSLPGDVAAVQLLGAEHGEVDAGRRHDLDQRAQAALAAKLERRIAQPEQHIACAFLGD